MERRKVDNPSLALVVFRCLRCNLPCTKYIITHGPFSDVSIKEHPFEPVCECGWSLPMTGAEATHILRVEWNFEMYYDPHNLGILPLESEADDPPQTKS
jgi:hypothetical protein